KLTDFGFAKIIEPGARTYTLCGTPEYIAPEVLLNKGHGKPVDWWTLGILIYEMIVGQPPFCDEEPMGIYQKILAGKIYFPKYFDKNAKGLVKKLLTADLSKRYGNLKNGADDIKKHKWFATIAWDKLVRKEIPPPYKPEMKDEKDVSNYEDIPESTELPPSVPAAADPFTDCRIISGTQAHDRKQKKGHLEAVVTRDVPVTGAQLQSLYDDAIPEVHDDVDTSTFLPDPDHTMDIDFDSDDDDDETDDMTGWEPRPKLYIELKEPRLVDVVGFMYSPWDRNFGRRVYPTYSVNGVDYFSFLDSGGLYATIPRLGNLNRGNPTLHNPKVLEMRRHQPVMVKYIRLEFPNGCGRRLYSVCVCGPIWWPKVRDIVTGLALVQQGRATLIPSTVKQALEDGKSLADAIAKLPVDSLWSPVLAVGTTKFDSLVQSVCEPDFLDFLHDKLGTKEVVIQYGNSSTGTLKVYEEVKQAAVDGMAIHGYSLKPEGINDDIRQADLVISHAGAGSIMDTLKVSRERGNERKPILCIVCNKALMGNHQQELANAMRPYALVANGPEELETVLSSLKDSPPKLKVYQEPDGMQRLVDAVWAAIRSSRGITVKDEMGTIKDRYHLSGDVVLRYLIHFKSTSYHW
ncbi:hypothetical protein FOZ62_015646, partial [Perkinsus olseni]